MAAFRQNSFLGGMLSPLLEGREDFRRAKDGGRVIRNFFVTPYGALVKRPGAQYLARAQSPVVAPEAGERERARGYAVRLVTFSISASEVYILEFTHLRIRVYVDGRAEEVIPSPYSGEDLMSDPLDDSQPGLKFAQNQNLLMITHPEYKPRILERTQFGAFALRLVEVGSGPGVTGIRTHIRREDGVRQDDVFVEFATVSDVVTYIVSKEVMGEGEIAPSSQASALILDPFHFARVFGPDDEGWYTADRPVHMDVWARVKFERDGHEFRVKEFKFTDDGRLTFRLIEDSTESRPEFTRYEA